LIQVWRAGHRERFQTRYGELATERDFRPCIESWPQREIARSLIQVWRAGQSRERLPEVYTRYGDWANPERGCKKFDRGKERSWPIQRDISRNLIQVRRTGKSSERFQEV
jgi:hypothetical protein